jgi:hypothetical protein
MIKVIFCARCGCPEGQHQFVTGRCPLPPLPSPEKWSKETFEHFSAPYKIYRPDGLVAGQETEKN